MRGRGLRGDIGQRSAAAARRRRRHEAPGYGASTGRGGRVGFYLTVIALILALVLIGMLIVYFLTSLFNISVFYTPNEGRHSAEELAEAAGLKLGEKIYSVDLAQAERRILEKYHEIGSVRLRIELPDKISIEPIYATAKYFVSLYGEYYTLSHDLLVLERVEDREYCTSLRLVEIVLPEIRRAVTSEFISFADDGSSEYVERMLTAVSESELYGLIDRLDMSSKFECSAVKKGQFKINFGQCKDERTKIKMAIKVMNEGGYFSQTGVFVDATDASEAVVAVRKNEKIE